MHEREHPPERSGERDAEDVGVDAGGVRAVARVEGGAFGPAADPRLRLGLTFGREADAASLPAGLDLSDEDAALVRASGDGLAFRDGATRLALYDPEAPYVQYRREAAPSGDTVYVALDAAPAPTDAKSAEDANLLVVARAVVASALARTESRGGHFRRDFPQSDPGSAVHSTLVGAPHA